MGLPLRQKHARLDSELHENSQKPFGIPIHDHLRSLKASESLKRDNPDDGFSQSPESKPSKKRKKRAIPHLLLCEKYRPSDFFDLLGNDDANRQVLRWMNYWKSIVFGTDPILNEYTDRLGRPQRKVLLLNGPPGTGKTTAAHVIANQAGFDVLEINASDERGASVVQDRIVSAIQSHQVHRKRPICIVADEVEGASEHGFVRALVNIINGDAIAMSNQNYNQQKSKNKKKKKYSLLQRPIIAVCNNAWASSLHSLRPLAEIVNFHRQPISKLVKQLEQICLLEKIKLDPRELVKVVEMSNLDIRSCLNALQFGALNDGALNLNELESVEMTSWNSLLRKQFGDRTPVPFKQIECCSDIDKLIQGCFTAYIDTGFNEDLIKRPAELGDYLALADNRHANDELKALTVHASGQLFRPPALAAAQGNIRSNHNWTFGRPVSTFETSRQTKGIIQSILKRSSNVVRTNITEKVAMLEILPMAINITSPKLNTVITPEDKSRLTLISKLLIELGINLKTEKLENGTFVHLLDPPLHQACVINEKERSEAAYGSYIARAKVKDALKDLKEREARQTVYSQTPLNTKQHQTTKDTEALKQPAKQPVDFSQFFQSTPQTTATQVERATEAKATRVWVQYSEGFSNAVRKNVTWDDLFSV